MRTNVILTEESEDVLTDFVKMSRPKKFKTKQEKINEALACLGSFMKHLDKETLLQVCDLKKT